MTIDAQGIDFIELNEKVRSSEDSEILIKNCLGQRYIGSGISGKKITIEGTPGNALGAYLDGGSIVVKGNAQDAAGDTMNDGMICVYGSAGDAVGYGMRGGKIFIKDNIGYRAGIHMKAYDTKIPVIVAGGGAGSFLGEYQAGGVIIVLGLNSKRPVGDFCGTGMHGGKIYIRCDELPFGIPKQVSVKRADEKDMDDLMPHLKEYCGLFSKDLNDVLSKQFYVLTPSRVNLYKQLYTAN